MIFFIDHEDAEIFVNPFNVAYVCSTRQRSNGKVKTAIIMLGGTRLLVKGDARSVAKNIADAIRGIAR